MTAAGNLLWNLGPLPFIWKSLDRPTNGGRLPDALPFRLGVNPRTGTLVQMPNRSVQKALATAYARGSEITGTMDDEGIGKQYAEDFLSFLGQFHAGRRWNNLRVLEIGCGTGYLLHRLKSSGACVLGVEPGRHGQEGAKKYSVPVIQDYFPCPRIEGKFDLILMYAVLEHVLRPLPFLKQVGNFLNRSGRIALAVPDCGPLIDRGDVSMLLHEHWNYFEERTLRASLFRAGCSDIRIEPARFGGCLYSMSGINHCEPKKRSFADASRRTISRALHFKRNARAALAKLAAVISNARSKRQSVGIYVPGRAINALALAGVATEHCRFFDDNPILHNTYFPGVDIPIESRSQLLSSPTDHVLILSRSFGPKLAAELARLLPAKTVIHTWPDFFGAR